MGETQLAVVDAAAQMKNLSVLQYVRGHLLADAAADVLNVLFILHIGQANSDQNQTYTRRELFHGLFQSLHAARIQSSQINDLRVPGKVSGRFITDSWQAGLLRKPVRIALGRAILAAIENDGLHKFLSFQKSQRVRHIGRADEL